MSDTIPAARFFDLAALHEIEKRQEDGVDVRIRFADGVETDWIVKMAGPDSSRVKVAAQRLTDARIRAQRVTLTAAEMAEQEAEIVASAVLGWNDKLKNGDGTVVEFTPENLRSVLRSPLILEQLKDAVNSRAIFMKG